MKRLLLVTAVPLLGLLSCAPDDTYEGPRSCVEFASEPVTAQTPCARWVSLTCEPNAPVVIDGVTYNGSTCHPEES